MTHSQLCLLALTNPDIPYRFIDWLRDNEHVWIAFEAEALKIIRLGIDHYSARTILHYLRHHSMVTESSEEPWKLNDHHSPYLGRLFAMVYPQHASFFDFRAVGR